MSRAWWMLGIASLLEVVWAVGLKYTDGFRRPLPTAITTIAMVATYYFLAQALKTLPVGTGYAVWTGIGTVGTAIVGIVILGEPRDAPRLLSLVLIVAGIIGLKLTTPSA